MKIELGTTNPQEAQSIIAIETTNSHEKWTKWFGKRELAENFASKVSSEYFPLYYPLNKTK